MEFNRMFEVGEYSIRGTFEDYSRPYTKEFSGRFTTSLNPHDPPNFNLSGELIDSDGKDSDIHGNIRQGRFYAKIEFIKNYRYVQKWKEDMPRINYQHYVFYELEFRQREAESGLWIGQYIVYQGSLRANGTKSKPNWVKCQIFPSIISDIT